VYGPVQRAQYDKHLNSYIELGISESLAKEFAITSGLFASLDILDISHELAVKISTVAEVYFHIEEFLDIRWIRTQIIIHATENNWESLSREALRDDLDLQQKQLTTSIIEFNKSNMELNTCIEKWAELYISLIERWRHVLTNLKSGTALNYTMYFVAIRELLDLTQTTLQVAELNSN